MSSDSADLREKQSAGFLERIPVELGGVLIGGYAVSAYGPARYSVDVDLVFPRDGESSVLEWLQREGIPAERTFEHGTGAAALTKLRIAQPVLSGDLYFGGLLARGTDSRVDYAWIAQRPRRIMLNLRSMRLSRPIPVARPEAIWVLKLLAGRSQDITDLFAMASAPVNLDEIREQLASYGSSIERTFLADVRSAVDRGDQFLDALSRRALGSPRLTRNVRAWGEFRQIVDTVIPSTSVQ